MEEKIIELRHLLDKYKEDVEQVLLFGMERNDFEEKKQKCRDIVLELRKLEEKAKEGSEETKGVEDAEANKTVL